MRYKLICCEVFKREIELALQNSEHTVIPVFTEKLSHENPAQLREIIQQEIDRTSLLEFDYILLGFGLCGNAITGLQSRRVPLVIPRAHDCCTILLGSREAFSRYFGHRPSCRWTSGGYMGTGENYLRNSDVHQFLGVDLTWAELVEKYGEENAEYIRETLTPKDGSHEQVVFIQTPPYENSEFQKKAEQDACQSNRKYELIQGDIRLLHMLVRDNWPMNEFLVVPENSTIEGVYDHDIVMKADIRIPEL